MSTDRQTVRIVRSWLEEGVTALPDRVLDAVLDHVPATPQRRPFWRARRFFQMTSPVRYAIAGAAVLALALVGYQLLPSTSGPGGPATAPPPPTATPTASPSATFGPLPLETTRLTPGTYILDSAHGLLIDVPAAWGTCCGGVILKTDMEGLGHADVSEIIVYADSCHSLTGGQSEPRGAAAIAAAFAAQVPRDASAPRNVTVAGTPAVHVRLTVPADMETDANDDFVDCEDSKFRTWGTASDRDARFQQGPGQVQNIYLVDLAGRTMLFELFSGPNTSASDKADLDAMLASIRTE